MRTFIDEAMTRPRQAAVLVCLLIVAASAALLVTGAPILMRLAIPSAGMPWGTPITWSGIAALWLAVRLVFPPRDELDEPTVMHLRETMNTGVFLGLTWGVAGYLLAGNWAFVFSGDSYGFQGSPAAAKLLWTYTKVFVATGFLLLPVAFYVRFALAWQNMDHG